MTSAHGMWDWGGSGPFEWIWMLVPVVLMIAFWSLLILLVVKLVRSRPSTTVRSPALDVLEERYARGEITRDDFLERKNVLTAEAAQ